MNEISLVSQIRGVWRLAPASVPATPTVPTPAPVWSDTELLSRLARREPDALSLVYDRYGAAIFRQLCAMLGSSSDAEDALQETFVALSSARVSQIRDLRAYLLGAARNQALSILRRRKREARWENIADVEIAAPENRESAHDFSALLARLPLEQREIIALKVWEELTFAEIAAIIVISPNTAQSRYRYGIEKLRAWCEEEIRD